MSIFILATISTTQENK
ncbi:hypothetical protein [Escherichia coli]|nr:hypothetical protein [Escherichia coli]